MQLTGQPIYFSYRYAERTAAEGKALPASVSYPDDVTWVTVPWDEHVDNPHEGPAEVTVGGWTFLYGPCVFSVTAEVRLYEMTPLAQAHVSLYETESADGAVALRRTAWEWEIGAKESHSAHLTGAWTGNLAAGRRLRVACDYWHADHPASIFGANVQGLYWRY